MTKRMLSDVGGEILIQSLCLKGVARPIEPSAGGGALSK
jgi:hypothetical protein